MITDVTIVNDEVYINDKQISCDTNNQRVIGEVEVVYNSKVDGVPIFTKNVYKNDLLVTGSVFMSEKNNNMRSGFTTVPIDLELGVHTQDEIIVDSTTIPNENVCGLMVGNGGAADTYNIVYKINRAERLVPGALPFRVVPIDNDLQGAVRDKYFLRVVKGDYVYYYGKRFDIEPVIHVEYEDGTVVPLDLDTRVNTKFIKVFTLYRVRVDKNDIREFFKITQGSTMKSLVNCLGLVSGYPMVDADGHTEFYNVRGITDVHMENHELKDSESTLGVTYKHYIV